MPRSLHVLLCTLVLLLADVASAQTETLLRPASSAGDQFGYDLALDGDRLLVGRPGDDTQGPEAGAALLYEYSNGVWTQSATLLPPSTTGYELFGNAVALGGDRAVVGAYLTNNYTGVVYVYDRVGSVWALTATLSPSDATAGQGFGYSLALDGDRLVVSALGDDTGATDAGAVYVFDYANGTWGETAKLMAAVPKQAATLGLAVDVSGNRVIASAPIGVTTAGDGGAAHVFTETGNGWTEEVLQAADQAPGDRFGQSVALDGTRAVVGAYYHRSRGSASGAAYVFDLAGTTWSETAKLVGSTTHEWQQFGSDVALAGDRIVVGGPSSNLRAEQGVAYVFDLDGTWEELYRLQASDGQQADYLGLRVTVGGTRVAAGAPFTDTGAATSGTAYVYETAGARPMPFFVAADAITVRKADAIVGGVVSNGTIELKRHSNGFAGYDADFAAVGAIDIDRRNVIDGDVTAGGALTVHPSATVTGTAQGSAVVAPEALPSAVSVTPGTQNVIVQAGESRTITRGSYKRIRVKDGGTLTLLGGTYDIDEFLINRNATVDFFVGDEAIVLNVVTKYIQGADADLLLTTFGGGEVPEYSASLTLNTAQTVDLVLGARSDFYGTINAPNALVSVRADAAFCGAIAARALDVKNRATLVAHGTPVSVVQSALAQSKTEAAPEAASLTLDAYPNPVVTTAQFRYTLPEGGDASLRVYDLLGRVVADVASGTHEEGEHTATFEASQLPSGVYIARLQTPRGAVTQRLTRVR